MFRYRSTHAPQAVVVGINFGVKFIGIRIIHRLFRNGLRDHNCYHCIIYFSCKACKYTSEGPLHFWGLLGISVGFIVPCRHLGWTNEQVVRAMACLHFWNYIRDSRARNHCWYHTRHYWFLSLHADYGPTSSLAWNHPSTLYVNPFGFWFGRSDGFCRLRRYHTWDICEVNQLP